MSESVDVNSKKSEESEIILEPYDIRDRPTYSPEEVEMNDGYHPEEFKEILLTYDKVSSRIKEIGEAINQYMEKFIDENGYTKEEIEVYPVYLEKGAYFFAKELEEYLDDYLIPDGQEGIEGIEVNSYVGNESKEISTGDSFHKFLDNVKGNVVIPIDDIVDKGKTIHYLQGEIWKREPLDVITTCLFDKPGRDFNPAIDFEGFKLPSGLWVAGFGMDLNDKYRDLDHVVVLDPRVKEALLKEG